MTKFIAQPNADGLVKVSGTIKNLKVTRAEASFVFTDSDQTKMGVVAKSTQPQAILIHDIQYLLQRKLICQ